MIGVTRSSRDGAGTAELTFVLNQVSKLGWL